MPGILHGGQNRVHADYSYGARKTEFSAASEGLDFQANKST